MTNKIIMKQQLILNIVNSKVSNKRIIKILNNIYLWINHIWCDIMIKSHLIVNRTNYKLIVIIMTIIINHLLPMIKEVMAYNYRQHNIKYIHFLLIKLDLNKKYP